MLDRTDFASWKQRIRLYYRGKENGVNILKSIDEGPFQIGTFRETLAEGNEGALHLDPGRPHVYSDLSPEDKDRYNADIRATNILLQGLPKDIYTLINHYTEAKDIWDNVKMLLEGSKLTKEDRESQLMQLNSKFVNNMLSEWGRFVTAVKLNRGLMDSNYDQLYAYLKQHEAYANENKMMVDRFTQLIVAPLALMSNASHQQTSSNTRNQATVQNGRVVVQNVQGRHNRGHRNNAWGAGAAGYGGSQNRVGNANPGQARQIKCYNCNAQENRVALDEHQLLFIAGRQDNVVDETMFMANLSFADPIYDEASPSYDSDILFEIAEITRKKMNEKMKYLECVKKKVKIAPHDYSKENYLATFTPQKQLNPEQIFWSKDLIKMKAKALKEQTTASRPIKALTVYPPNTLATLVPRVLPTKSQVKN
ncbi:hypothetical protein Tco_1087469 [Tanacetum coccineum]